MGHLNAQAVVREIEFELAQGMVTRRDLRLAIHAVKEFQAKVRSEIFTGVHAQPDMRDVASRVFQVNEMLLTLLQEMAAATDAAQQEAKHASRVLHNVLSVDAIDATAQVESLAQQVDLSPDSPSSAELVEALRDENMNLKLDVRPVKAPIVGGLLKRIRIGLHRVALYYVQQLAKKQRAINRIHGDWTLDLIRLSQRQQAEIEALQLALASIRSRLKGLE